MSLRLAGGLVATALDPPEVAEADVVIEGDRITAVGSAPRSGPLLDCSGCLIVPGNVNAHAHLYSALARGMPSRLDPPASFLQILQRVWWRLDRALDEDSIRASAVVGGMEALLSGTTTIVDHHASPNAIDGSLDVIADALGALGLRSVLCYEVSDRDGPGRAAAGIRENERFLSGAQGMAAGMMGLHASFTLSTETLAACGEAAGAFHVHVAEGLVDQADSEARFGKPVVARLADAAMLNGRSILAHCVHVHPSEIALIEESGTFVAHNPRSNMNNGVGRAPAAALGSNVGLGTDGIDGDMFAEGKTAYWRARDAGDEVSPGWVLARMAASARLVNEVRGQRLDQPPLGSVEPGGGADLVILDYQPPTPLTGDNLPGHWVFGLSSRHVRDVVVAGEVVVRDRRLAKADEDELVATAAVEASRLWERVETIEPHAFEPQGG